MPVGDKFIWLCVAGVINSDAAGVRGKWLKLAKLTVFVYNSFCDLPSYLRPDLLLIGISRVLLLETGESIGSRFVSPGFIGTNDFIWVWVAVLRSFELFFLIGLLSGSILWSVLT